jgi:hypothetical protein
VPQPAEVDEIATRLTDVFAAAQDDIEHQLATTGSTRAAARLRQLQRTVNLLTADLDRHTRAWLLGDLPAVYELGAATAAQLLDEQFLWTAPHLRAVQAAATRTFGDLLSATRFVRADVKDWIRSAARQQTTFSIIEGHNATVAARRLAEAAGNQLGVFTVRYKNGSRHRLADYADSTLRAVTGTLYNDATINQATQLGVRFFECADGSDCGLTSHEDGEKPNGKIYPADVAGTFPLSHPRCRRSWIPRIDARSTSARSLRSDEQRADQAESELATGRASRAPRPSREPRPARTARAS